MSKAKQVIEFVTLAQTYSFWTEEGALLYWSAGHVVTDPEEIKLLQERKAPLVEGE